jgi:hypothetical protein
MIDNLSRAVIKTSSKEKVVDALKHAHTCYLNPTIRSFPHTRAIYNATNTPSSPECENLFCLAFEWMDCTLKDVDTESRKRDAAFYKNVTSAVLEALAELKSQQLVHTGTCNTNKKGENTLISLRHQARQHPHIWPQWTFPHYETRRLGTVYVPYPYHVVSIILASCSAG